MNDNNQINTQATSDNTSEDEKNGDNVTSGEINEQGGLSDNDSPAQGAAELTQEQPEAAPEEQSEEAPEEQSEAIPEEQPDPQAESSTGSVSEEDTESKAVTEVLKDVEESQEPGKKAAGTKAKLIAALAVLALAAVAALAVFYLCTHAILGDIFGKHEIYSSGTTQINLSGSDYRDYSQLSKLKALEVIDLTGSAFENLPDLYGCESLKKAVFADKEFAAEDCKEFYSHVPGAYLVCKINIDGQVYDSGTTRVKVENADARIQKLFGVLKKLEYLDLRKCDVSDETYLYLTEALPECDIIIRTMVCGTEYTTDAQSLKLDGKLTKQDAARVGYFRNLVILDVKRCENPDILNTFLAAHPDVRLNNPVELLGRLVGTEDEFADLRGSKYTLEQVKAALDETLPKMKSLKKIDMCGCGLTNKEMEQLCRDYPDIKFVWIVHFKRWSVRTDAVVFSTLNGNGMEYYDQNDYAPVFKYCTDLVALDMGHSLIYDISPIASLKKLKAVIFTDNKIRDISAFSELKDLEFIEMNVNRVQSAAPLKNLDNLKYINFWSSMGMKDLSPLYNHPSLKIAILHRSVPGNVRDKFRKTNPGCQTFFRVDYKLSTNRAWRKNPYRKKIKVAFRDWKYVVGYNEKTNKFIFDYNTDQYSIM